MVTRRLHIKYQRVNSSNQEGLPDDELTQLRLFQVDESHAATPVHHVSAGRTHGHSHLMPSVFPSLPLPLQTTAPLGGCSQSEQVHRSVTRTVFLLWDFQHIELVLIL